jgi:hypothetical protein
MNISALTLSAAAALSPTNEPITYSEVQGSLNPAARAVALDDMPPAEPLPDQDPQPQNAQSQDPQAKPAQPNAAPPVEQKPAPTAESTTAPATEAKVAQEPAKQQVELTPQEKLDFSVALQQLKTLDSMVYKRIIAGEPVDQVLKDVRAALETAKDKNEVSLSSIERALKDPETFAAAQKNGRDRIDKKMDDGFNLREDVYGGKSGWESKIMRLKGGETAEKLALCDALRGALQVSRDEAGVLHNAMPAPYLSDSTLRGALTVTPVSKVTRGLSAEQRRELTILSSPNDPSKPLRPEEVRTLTDAEKAARFEKDRPVEGKDPRPELREAREATLEKLSDSQKEALFAVEKLAREVTEQDIVRNQRGIPPGIKYHVELDASNSARGVWQGIDNYATAGVKQAYEGSIQLREAVRPFIPRTAGEIGTCTVGLEQQLSKNSTK